MLIRSSGVFQGYYKQPEATRDTLTADGWANWDGGANTYGFFGLVGLDHNSQATGEMRAVNQSLTSLHFLP